MLGRRNALRVYFLDRLNYLEGRRLRKGMGGGGGGEGVGSPGRGAVNVTECC